MYSNTFGIQHFYKEGKTDYFTVQAPNGDKLHFAGQVREYFAVKHFNRISNCLNCVNLKWCGVIMGMCANCGLDTGAQKGFINFGQECEDETHAHLPSVFDKGQYLYKCWDLKQVGDKYYENTIRIMADGLTDYLLEKFGVEKLSAILGLRAYLRSLDHEPREAIARLNEMWHIPEDQLYCRNWAALFGPHFDENGDYIGSDIDTNADTDVEVVQAPSRPPVLTREDTVLYHYGSSDNDDDHNYDNYADAVSEISECDLVVLSPEQQEQPDQVINDVGNTP